MKFKIIEMARAVPGIRKTVGEELLKYKNSIDKIYISFTNVDKLGINPKSGYNTPLGIYCYPLDVFIKRYGDIYFKTAIYLSEIFPFAATAPYIYVFKAKNPDKVIYDLNGYNTKNYDNDIEKLIKKYGVESVARIWKTRYARMHNPSKSIWNVTSQITKKITGSHNAILWNNILSKTLGYDGIADRSGGNRGGDFDGQADPLDGYSSGQGIIHPAEPTQAVFFNKAGIEVIEKIYNNGTLDTQSKSGGKTGEDAEIYRIRKELKKKGVIEASGEIITGKITDYGLYPIHKTISDIIGGYIKVKDAKIEFLKRKKIIFKSGYWENSSFKNWPGGKWEAGYLFDELNNTWFKSDEPPEGKT